MRRPKRLGLAIVVLSLALCGAYTVFWLVAAGRIKEGLALWAQSLQAHNLAASWRTVEVGGFPFAFRVELHQARLRDTAAAHPSELDVPVLSGRARPWNFRVWQLTASGGPTASVGALGARLTAQAATGSVVITDDGGARAWLSLSAPVVDAGLHFTAHAASLWLVLPEHPPLTHTDPAIGVALDLRDVTLPVLPAPLQNPIDEIAFGITLMGQIPDAAPRQAAALWRDSGGTLELDHVALRWGTLAITGSGTLALDRDLQPMGSFSGAVEGYDRLVAVLVASGRMRARDVRLARLALAMLAKAGPDGKPQIATSFSIQDGEMYLGPVKLGPAPRIAWE